MCVFKVRDKEAHDLVLLVKSGDQISWWDIPMERCMRKCRYSGNSYTGLKADKPLLRGDSELLRQVQR